MNLTYWHLQLQQQQLALCWVCASYSWDQQRERESQGMTNKHIREARPWMQHRLPREVFTFTGRSMERSLGRWDQITLLPYVMNQALIFSWRVPENINMQLPPTAAPPGNPAPLTSTDELLYHVNMLTVILLVLWSASTTTSCCQNDLKDEKSRQWGVKAIFVSPGAVNPDFMV